MANQVVRFSPLHAVVFSCIFQNNEKAKAAMLEFLNAVLEYVGEDPIVEIIDMKSEYSVLGESADQKYGRLDVRVKDIKGRIFDIEVQIDKDYMNERGFFYGGRIAEDEFPSGTPYNEIPEVRVISVVDFYVRDSKKAIVEPVFLMYGNEPHDVATEKFKMYHVQLPAFRKKHKTLKSVMGDTLFTWLYTFDRGYQDPEEMEVLAGMSEGLRSFAERYNYAINDPEMIRRYRLVEDGKREVATKVSAAEKRGADHKNRENARGFKASGVDPAIIAHVTGLSLSEIAKL